MTQKICFDCFHKLFPDKPIRKVTLGRQCVVCKAQTDRTEQMIPVEAEDIPLVKQIALLHRTERHADQRVAVRVAARGAGYAAHRAARRRSARGNGRAGMERPPSAPQQVHARIRSSTRHWLSQEDDALVYAREVHMDCSRVRRDADDRADLVHIGIFPLEECPHPKVLGVELIRSNLDILRRRHK